MDMTAGMFNADPSDDFAVARAWAWLLPEDLAETPGALRSLEDAGAWRVGGDALAKLPGAVVHELHRLIRLRLFPWNMAATSVADYIIYEGMAESFATSLFSEEVVGYYVTDFDDDQLETARALVRDGLDETGFNIIRGYAIGYRVVQAYLQRTGTTVEEATFLTADEVIRQSSFFD